MKKPGQPISEENELAFYTNEINIPNQKLVQETIAHFETGAGALVFASLNFLNLLWKQRQFVNSNLDNSSKVLSHLRALPLTAIEKHVLLGFILKWVGGYPVHLMHEDDQIEININNTYKEIELEFLSYQGNTPEKEICRADKKQRQEFMKLGIALSTAINHNVSAEEIYTSLTDDDRKDFDYSTFDDLFKDAAQNGSVGDIKNQQEYLLKRSRYNFEFNVWLSEKKGWEYGDESNYRQLLTVNNFNEFLQKDKQLLPVVDILNTPLCTCIKVIQDRYVAIRNKAMEADRESNPTLHWLRVEYKVLEEAIRKYSGVYFNELLTARHSCKEYVDIIKSLEDDEVYWETQKSILSVKSYNDKKTERRNKWQEQIRKWEERLKIYTSQLGELSARDYWILENSILRLRLVDNLDSLLGQQSGTEASKITIAAYALMHVYLSMYNGQSVTMANKNKLAQSYGYNSGDQLRNEFTKYKDEAKRLDLNTVNKRSAVAHLRRLESILPLLKTQNEQAHHRAKEEYDYLKKQYDKYH